MQFFSYRHVFGLQYRLDSIVEHHQPSVEKIKFVSFRFISCSSTKHTHNSAESILTIILSVHNCISYTGEGEFLHFHHFRCIDEWIIDTDQCTEIEKILFCCKFAVTKAPNLGTIVCFLLKNGLVKVANSHFSKYDKIKIAKFDGIYLFNLKSRTSWAPLSYTQFQHLQHA